MSSKELDIAIDHASLSRLQVLIKTLCDEFPEARALVEDELLTAPTAVIDLTGEDSQPKSGEKRPRFAMCANCKDEFETTKNHENGCRYHPGKLETNYDDDFWADHDEDTHGEITNEMSEEFPEGFIWTCCHDAGDYKGCKIGPHEADANYRPELKRRRIWE